MLNDDKNLTADNLVKWANDKAEHNINGCEILKEFEDKLKSRNLFKKIQNQCGGEGYSSDFESLGQLKQS